MAQTMGATSPTGQNLLKTRYEDLVLQIIPRRRPLLGFMRRVGSKIPTQNKEFKFGLQTNRVHGYTETGQNDPTTYSYTTGGLDFVAPTVTYRKGWLTFQISRETEVEGTAAGALTDVKRAVLENAPDSVACDLERLLCIQKGDGILFRASSAASAASTTAVTIDELGGFTGQEIGHVLRNMNLVGMQLQVSATSGGNYRSATGAMVASYVDTLGSESITPHATVPGVGWSTGGVVDNDYFTPKNAFSTTGSATYWRIGLPGLVDDGTRLTSFQGITISTTPEFKSTVISNGGTKIPLSEDILSRALLSARVRSSANHDDEGYCKWIITMSDSMQEQFAQTLRADRRFGAPNVLDIKGVKPYAGVDTRALHFNGIPVITSPMHQRNSCYVLDTEDLFLVHNGPVFGGWMVQGHDMESGPQKQWVWEMNGNFGMRVRNSSVRIDDLTTMTGI